MKLLRLGQNKANTNSLSLHLNQVNQDKANHVVGLPRWLAAAAAAARLLQSCPTLCDPRDGSPPGSPVPGILQARTLEWVAISFSNTWKWKVKVKSFSRVQLLATPWTAAYQAPPSMEFSRPRVLEWVAIAFSKLIGREIKILENVRRGFQDGENRAAVMPLG